MQPKVYKMLSLFKYKKEIFMLHIIKSKELNILE